MTIRDGAGVLGRGLVAYDADEAARIVGRPSREIEAILGYAGRAEMVHRDDMALHPNRSSRLCARQTPDLGLLSGGQRDQHLRVRGCRALDVVVEIHIHAASVLAPLRDRSAQSVRVFLP